MPITISQYTDAVSNPNGRFRTLVGIYPILDDSGDPLMNVNENCVNFSMIFDGKRYNLTCPLGNKNKLHERLRETATFTSLIDTPYLVPCSYLDHEMMVCDTEGRIEYADVMIHEIPHGETLDRFLRQATANKDIASMAKLLLEMGTMIRWLWENDFSTGKISFHNIIIPHSTVPVIGDYTHSCHKRSLDEVRAWSAMLAAIYCCGAEPDLYGTFIEEHLSGKSKLMVFAEVVNELIGKDTETPFSKLIAHIVEEPADKKSYVTRLFELSRDIATSEISEIPALRQMSEFITDSRRRDASAEKKSRLAKYSYIGEMNCNKMRAFDGKSWEYIDKSGNPAFEGRYLEASDFEEDRAVVETETGYGLIDETGNFIIDPVFDDINWDSYNNIAIVTRDGKSGIYDRTGNKITDLVYDQILDCSEGLVPVRKEDKYGYLRKDGSQAIDFIYDDAFGFRDGMARVRLKGNEIIIDISGNIIDYII